MALISLDTSTEQLKQYRSLLHTTAILGTATGLFVWSITPFLTSNKLARYGSLIFSLATGISTLYCGVKLEQTKALYEAIKKAEKSDFLTRLAASEYRQQQQWELLSQSPLEELPQNLQPTSDTYAMEVSNSTQGENLQTSTSTSQTSDELDMEAVREAVSNGKSDTWIVENILQMGGRKFKEGKQLLNEIKAIINHQSN